MKKRLTSPLPLLVVPLQVAVGRDAHVREELSHGLVVAGLRNRWHPHRLHLLQAFVRAALGARGLVVLGRGLAAGGVQLRREDIDVTAPHPRVDHQRLGGVRSRRIRRRVARRHHDQQPGLLARGERSLECIYEVVLALRALYVEADALEAARISCGYQRQALLLRALLDERLRTVKADGVGGAVRGSAGSV